ncbi:MAG: PAS domain-containing protein [Succinivibrionaceae bacterium]|nr:PAS domain-containing protein [Succinivibrionaceae bacterium]
MDVNLQVQQSEDVANFASRITQKYRNCMVVNLSDGTCYNCGLRAMEDSSMEEPDGSESYSEWLRIFTETEIELPEQSRMKWMLSMENLRQSLNDHHFFISVTYRNRRLPNDECWQRLQVVLLESDNMGIPQRVMMVQEKISGSILAGEQRFFRCGLFGVMQFSVVTDGLNRWRRFSYLNVNEEALRIFGYTQDEFYEGMRSQQIDLIAPQDIANFIDLVSSLNQPGERSEVHLHIINRSGYVVVIGGEAELCVNEDGRRFIQIIFIDESKEESGREVIAGLKKELKDLTEAIPCAVHRSLMAGKSTTEYVSREFTVLTGYDCTDLKLKFDGVFQNILATADDVKAFNSGFSRALTTGARVAVDLNVKRGDGSVVAVRDWLYVTHDARDRLWLYGCMLENTTEVNNRSRAENFEEIADYCAAGFETISRVSALLNAQGDGKKPALADLAEVLARDTGASVAVYRISDEKASAEAVCWKTAEGEKDVKPDELEIAGISRMLDACRNAGFMIAPNEIVLKSALSVDLAGTAFLRDARQLVALALVRGDACAETFLVIKNPQPWIMHHQIPKTLADMLLAVGGRFL